MSVAPAVELPLTGGPPVVSRKMLLKLLKLKANDATIKGATATSNNGKVTFRKTCQAPPPSTRAASYNSAGIDCSAPIETRKKYGNVNQMLTRITDTRAQFLSNNQGCAR